MLHRIHQKLGTAGFIISIVALVAALGGGAYAAGGALTGKQKKEVEKIAKKYAGKPGVNGSPGATGLAGSPGAKGDNGAPGANGTNGTSGAAGTSVTNTALAKGSATCPEGGAEFKVGTGAATRACNGVTGFTETLPPGKTETGVWNLSIQPTEASFETQVPLSFSIPLAKAGTSAFFFTREEVELEAFEGGCKWKLDDPEAKPEATQPGTLCIFTSQEELSNTIGPFIHPPGAASSSGYGPSGAYMLFIKTDTTGAPGAATALGTWAVTAPTS